MTRAIEHDTSTAAALRHGVVAAQAREFDRARMLLEQVIAQTPDDVHAWYWLAVASSSADKAIPCLRRVLAIDAQHEQARDSLSRLLVAEARTAAYAGRHNDSRALALEASNLTPESIAPWQTLAEFATTQVDRIEAMRRLVALTPESDALRNQLRRTLLARAVSIASTDRNEARMRFREVATLNPNDPRIWQALCNLAETRVEQMQCLRALIRVAPDHREGRDKLRHILVETARDLMAANSRAEARTCWREAVDITGGDVELWLGLAEATSDDEEAAQALQSAYELDPRDLRTLDALQRRKGIEIDPSALPTIDDAFARFDPAANGSGPTILDGESVDDSLFDALSQLPGVPQPNTAPAPEPVPPQEPAAIVASMIESLDAVATDAAIVAPTPEVAVTIAVAAPVEVPSSAEVAPPVEVTPPVESAPADEAATVMVVDDSPTIRKILGLTLERAGYRVLAEANGQSALQRLEEVLPRVILLDISMPDLDGYEVCKRIKQNPRTTAVPVIMLSGKGAFFDKVKGHMAGATEYLTKPFETPAVLAVVTSHCQGTVEARHG